MRRTLYFAVAIMFLFSMIGPSVTAVPYSNVSNISNVDNQILDTCQHIIDNLNAQRNLHLSIQNIKSIKDFSDNTYYAIECAPYGYLIICASTNIIVEFAEASVSPYSGYESGLYYGGPTFYYVQDGLQYRHVWYNEYLSQSDAIAAQKTSAMLHDTITNAAKKNTTLIRTLDLDYNNTYITDAEIFESLGSENEMGYSSGGYRGICGYVASGLLLLWHRISEYEPLLINGFAYLKDDGSKFIDGDFSHKLFYDFGAAGSSSGTGIFGDSISEVLTKYGESINIEMDCCVDVLPTEEDIIDMLDMYDKPIIVFGSVRRADSDTILHAVVAYGYTPEGRIIAHYGHKGYPHVEVFTSLPFGSSLYLDDYTVHDMTFSDIEYDSWAYEPVAYCVRYGIMNSTSVNSSAFGANNPTTRASFINALYHLAGEPEVTAEAIDDTISTFTDYSRDTVYYRALAWGYINGIITGTSATTLAPEQYVIREQAAAFMYRFNQLTYYNFEDEYGPCADEFDDYDSVSIYARHALNWATRRYLISGYPDNTLAPLDVMTTAQCATVIHNFTNVATYP